jgi:hypothetical protein
MNPGSTVLGCGPREFTVSYLRLFVTGLQRRRPDFDTRPGHVGFLVSNVAWDAFSRSTSVSPAIAHSINGLTFIYIPGLVQ